MFSRGDQLDLVLLAGEFLADGERQFRIAVGEGAAKNFSMEWAILQPFSIR